MCKPKKLLCELKYIFVFSLARRWPSQTKFKTGEGVLSGLSQELLDFVHGDKLSDRDLEILREEWGDFEEKYNQLAIDLRAKGWEVHPLCVEVGARGFIFAESWLDMVKAFDLSRAENMRLKEAVQLTALHCSHAIFIHRFRREWEPKPLLDVSQWNQRSQ